MSLITAGMTGTQFIAALNKNLPVLYNVESYGAVHDGATDDTVAIQTGINAVITAGGGVLYFPMGVYVIGGALQNDIGTDAIDYNSQLYIPFCNNTNIADRVSITLRGEASQIYMQSVGISTVTTTNTGVILKSTITGSGTNPTVISSGAASGGTYLNNNNNECHIENIQIMPVADGSNRLTTGGINLRRSRDVVLKNVSCFPWELNLVDSGIPQNNCVGIALPLVDCEHMNFLENVNVGGFETGFSGGEHTTFINTVAICCLYGYDFTANVHLAVGYSMKSFWCANNIKISGVCYLRLMSFNVEWDDVVKWYTTQQTVLDASNYGHGEIYYNIVEANVGFNNAKFSKSGGANLQCIPIGFAAAASFTVSGARDEPEGALANLLTALAAKGIIINSTTAS